MTGRRDPFHKILYVQRGRVELHLHNGRNEDPKPGAAGTVFIVSAGQEHALVDLSPSVILLLCLGPDWLARAGLRKLWKGLATTPALALGGAAATGWERLWRHALLEQEHARPGAAVLRDALALQLLVLLARAPTRRHENSAVERVRRVTHEIGETLFEPWSIDAAAARAGLSRRHFTQCFRQLHAQTFSSYLSNRRLDHAQRLLQTGRHTVTGAAFSSGFEDLAHFYRLFKRRHRQPPGRWLHENRPT